MNKWYWKDDGQTRGPFNSRQLKELAAAGRISGETMITREGSESWIKAKKVKGLFDEGDVAPEQAANAHSAPGRANVFSEQAASERLRSARHHATSLLGDLRKLNWKEEIIPVDASNLRLLTRDYVFWSVLLLGTVPTLIGTINDDRFQLSAYLLFFAAAWGVIFRDFIVRAPVSWKWLTAAAAFTGLIGAPALKVAYNLLPEIYSNLPNSNNLFVRLAGNVLTTGLTEELCKAIPVLLYLIAKRKNAEPFTAVLIGVFSGLGFAAIENMAYANASILEPIFGLQRGAAAYAASVRSVISAALLRSLSDVFGHALLSGIVAYFLVMAFLTARRAPVLAVVGLSLAATLHGVFNWLAPLQLTFATIIDVFAFLLFFGYLSKLRNLAAQPTPTPMFERTSAA